MSGKGKYALATERRRLVWARVIWPLVLELGEPSFTLAQYRAKRAEACSGDETRAASRGLASLAQKGVLLREGDLYSIHYRLVPYLRMGAECDYATAMHEAGRL